jgi:hypothetical protein
MSIQDNTNQNYAADTFNHCVCREERACETLNRKVRLAPISPDPSRQTQSRANDRVKHITLIFAISHVYSLRPVLAPFPVAFSLNKMILDSGKTRRLLLLLLPTIGIVYLLRYTASHTGHQQSAPTHISALSQIVNETKREAIVQDKYR